MRNAHTKYLRSQSNDHDSSHFHTLLILEEAHPYTAAHTQLNVCKDFSASPIWRTGFKLNRIQQRLPEFPFPLLTRLLAQSWAWEQQDDFPQLNGESLGVSCGHGY